jgi:ketosteroid isomerase-like protein
VLSEHSGFVAAARALDEAFARYASAGDLDRLVAACYAEDAQVLAPNVPVVRGRGQIRELLREMLEAGVGEVTRETGQLHVSGELGYGVGRYTWAVLPSGDKPRRDIGKYVLVYRRKADGSWKVGVEIFSSDLPSAERP